MHPVLELIHQRVSVERFQPDPLDEDEIRALVADAVQAPSSFNLQHWRFIAVRDAQDKQRLKDAAFGQQQVAEAGVTFILLGDLRAVDCLPVVLGRAVESGALPERKATAWLQMAREAYADPQAAREEAIRSCSLAAMTLMLSAEARGLAAGALTGFDPGRVCHEFDISDRYLPVMLLAVGYPAGAQTVRQPRLTVDEVLCWDRGGDL